MTDIVERLRKADKFSGLAVGHYWNLCEEAADEIERLRRERDGMATWMQSRDAYHRHLEEEAWAYIRGYKIAPMLPEEKP